DLDPRLARGQPVRSGANRLALEDVRTNLLVILCRHDPAGARDVTRTQQQQKIEERFLEAETDGALIDDVHGLGLSLEGRGERTAIALVAELDVLGRDWLTVVKLDAVAKPKGRAFAVLIELVALRKGGMVVKFGAEILDQCIMQCREEIVWRRRAVMVLRVQPARYHGRVPGERHGSTRGGRGRRRTT